MRFVPTQPRQSLGQVRNQVRAPLSPTLMNLKRQEDVNDPRKEAMLPYDPRHMWTM